MLTLLLIMCILYIWFYFHVKFKTIIKLHFYKKEKNVLTIFIYVIFKFISFLMSYDIKHSYVITIIYHIYETKYFVYKLFYLNLYYSSNILGYTSILSLEQRSSDTFLRRTSYSSWLKTSVSLICGGAWKTYKLKTHKSNLLFKSI